MKLGTPLAVNILLHYHSCPEPFTPFSDVANEITNELTNEEVIKWDKEISSFRTTEKGNAWVRMLTALDSPKAAFVDSEGRVV